MLRCTVTVDGAPVLEGQRRDDSTYWESGKPYFYARVTEDGRAMIGGEDEDFDDPQKRDALLRAKTFTLVEKFRKLFPTIRLEPELRSSSPSPSRPAPSIPGPTWNPASGIASAPCVAAR